MSYARMPVSAVTFRLMRPFSTFIYILMYAVTPRRESWIEINFEAKTVLRSKAEAIALDFINRPGHRAGFFPVAQ